MIARTESIASASAAEGRGLRVLLIAEAANPEWVSVPLEGWSHSRAIAELTDAHVVTQIRNSAAFERAGHSARDFTAIDSERVAGVAYRLGQAFGGRNGKGWTTLTAVSSLSYYYFERLVWKQFRERIRAGEFDIVHRVTPLSPTVPSLIAGACRRAGVPFVLGPLNGGVPWPAGFDSARRKEREWLSYVRGAYHMLPGYRSTRRNASAIIIGSRDTWQQMPRQYKHKCVYIPENGLDSNRLGPQRVANPRRPLRIVFLGRLVPYKGADMLVEAATSLIKAGLVTLTIIGDGPERSRLESMVRRSDLQSGVTFAGWVEHTAAQRMLHDADVLGFPSIREFGGAVVLEAMAAGVVPIVVDYGGPGELVTPSSGYAIPIGPRRQIVDDLRSVLTRIARDPAQLVDRAAAAQCRARTQFTWRNKARQCLEVYRWVLGQREDKPDFGMPLPDPDKQAVESPPTRMDVAAASD